MERSSKLLPTILYVALWVNLGLARQTPPSTLQVRQPLQPGLQQVVDPATDTLLTVTFPADSDTVVTKTIRYGAKAADTSLAVFVNGEQQVVYPSGAVVGILALQPGWNRLSFRAVTPADSQETVVRVYRIPAPVTLPPAPTRIVVDSIEPSNHVTFYERDRIIVRFQGSPGGKAAFRIDQLTDGKLPMTELAPREAGGLKGVYEGVYTIRPADHCEGERVVFWLKGTKGLRKKRRSRARVTVTLTNQPLILKTVGASNLVYYRPGSEIYMDLPEGIALQAVADLGRWWKVAVSSTRQGYILKESVTLTPRGRDLPAASLSAISSGIDSNWVTLTFGLSNRVPYRLSQDSSPERLSITFHRTHFADEWTQYPYQDDLIERFTWEQLSDDMLRFDITLSSRQQWGFRGWYAGTQFKLAIRRPPRIEKENPFANLIIALDPGHGGEHTGAVGATGLLEKDVNLIYAQYLAELLTERGARVILTRTEDSTMTLKERVYLAREGQAHILVWLHNNGVGDSRPPLLVSGTSAFYTHLQGLPFVRAVYPHLLALGLEPRGQIHRNYYVTRQTDLVIYLVEGAFLTHPLDEMFLLDDGNLRKLAGAVYQGLEDRLNALAR